MDTDEAYFARRALAEVEAAGKSTTEAAKNVHLELAARYKDLASSIFAHSVRLGLNDNNSTARQPSVADGTGASWSRVSQ